MKHLLSLGKDNKGLIGILENTLFLVNPNQLVALLYNIRDLLDNLGSLLLRKYADVTLATCPINSELLGPFKLV